MKRIVLLAGLLGAFAAAPALAQESPAAEALRQRAMEDEIKSLQATIVDLKENMQILQKQIDRMRDDVVKAREEAARALSSANNNSANEARFKSLETSVTEVDRKRQADNEKLSKYIDRSFTQLEKDLATKLTRSAAPAPTPGPPPENRPPPPRNGNSGNNGNTGSTPGPGSPTAPAGATESGLEWTVRDKDTLSRIGMELRKSGIKVTDKQIMDANPTVKWNRLQVGQKIFIPKSAP
jgi:TolA-binding protein